jgi:DNA adenine methylase
VKKVVSPLRWAGGKQWLVDEIQTAFEQSGKTCFFEPFVGGGSAFLNVQAGRRIIADVNPYLINFWRCIRDGLEHSVLENIRSNDESSYYAARSDLNEYAGIFKGGHVPQYLIRDNVRLASLFYYLNKTCFNGLWRVNSKGEMNVPYGKRKNVDFSINANISSTDLDILFSGYRDSIEGMIRSGSIKNCFVYADPPYVDGFTSYGKDGFDMEDQIKLISLLKEAADAGASVMVSNRYTVQMDNLYTSHGMDVRLVDGPRSIAANGNRASVKEILATKG